MRFLALLLSVVAVLGMSKKRKQSDVRTITHTELGKIKPSNWTCTLTRGMGVRKFGSNEHRSRAGKYCVTLLVYNSNRKEWNRRHVGVYDTEDDAYLALPGLRDHFQPRHHADTEDDAYLALPGLRDHFQPRHHARRPPKEAGADGAEEKSKRVVCRQQVVALSLRVPQGRHHRGAVQEVQDPPDHDPRHPKCASDALQGPVGTTERTKTFSTLI